MGFGRALQSVLRAWLAEQPVAAKLEMTQRSHATLSDGDKEGGNVKRRIAHAARVELDQRKTYTIYDLL